MFHPYSIQGGTATLDPQLAGMNGHSRIPEMFGNPCVPNYAGGFPFAGLAGTPVTGVPIAQTLGYPHAGAGMFGAVAPTPFGHATLPFGYATTPYGTTPYVNPYFAAGYNPYAVGAQTIPGINTIPGMPFVNTMPASPFVNTVPTNPYFNTIPTVPFVNTIPTTVPTSFGYGVNTFPATTYAPTVANPINPIVPTPYGHAVCQPTTILIPTPAGLVPVTVPSVNPYLNNPYAWTNYPFRSPLLQPSIFPTIGSTGAGPVSVTPFVDPLSLISACTGTPGSFVNPITTLNPLASIAAACNPFALSGVVNPTTPQFINHTNPFANLSNPFAANTAWNSIHTAGVNNPFFQGLPHPLAGVSRNPAVFQNYNPWVNPISNAVLGNPWINNTPVPVGNPLMNLHAGLQHPGAAAWMSCIGANPLVAGNPFLATALNAGVTTPGLGIPMINPITGTTNPFFSPTNIAYGVPGFPGVVPTNTGVTTTPFGAATIGCGPVCCN